MALTTPRADLSKYSPEDLPGALRRLTRVGAMPVSMEPPMKSPHKMGDGKRMHLRRHATTARPPPPVTIYLRQFLCDDSVQEVVTGSLRSKFNLLIRNSFKSCRQIIRQRMWQLGEKGLCGIVPVFERMPPYLCVCGGVPIHLAAGQTAQKAPLLSLDEAISLWKACALLKHHLSTPHPGVRVCVCVCVCLRIRVCVFVCGG